MKKICFYVVIFIISFFINACYTYEDDINIVFFNNSSYDLHINLRMEHKTAEHRGNVNKGETISFRVIFSGRGNIFIPIDRWSFQDINANINRIVFINLENNEVIKERDNLTSANIHSDHAFRTYRIEITDSLLFQGFN